MESIKKNKVLLSAFVITFIIFVYFFFFNGSSTTVSTLGDLTGDNQVVNGQVLHMLDQLNAVSVDQTLFTSTAWMSLKDMSTPLPVDTPGKSNPFSPLGSQ